MGIEFEPLGELEEKYTRIIKNVLDIRRKLDKPFIPQNRRDALRAALKVQQAAANRTAQVLQAPVWAQAQALQPTKPATVPRTDSEGTLANTARRHAL